MAHLDAEINEDVNINRKSHGPPIAGAEARICGLQLHFKLTLDKEVADRDYSNQAQETKSKKKVSGL